MRPPSIVDVPAGRHPRIKLHCAEEAYKLEDVNQRIDDKQTDGCFADIAEQRTEIGFEVAVAVRLLLRIPVEAVFRVKLGPQRRDVGHVGVRHFEAAVNSVVSVIFRYVDQHAAFRVNERHWQRVVAERLATIYAGRSMARTACSHS